MIYFIYDKTDRGNINRPVGYCTKQDKAQKVVDALRLDVSDYAQDMIYFEESGPNNINCLD